MNSAMLPMVTAPFSTSVPPMYTVSMTESPISDMISGKKSAFTKVSLRLRRLYSWLASPKRCPKSASRTNALSTRMPLKASCTNVERFERLCCISSDLLFMMLFTRYMLMDSMGRGMSAYSVSLGFTWNMMGITMRKRVMRFIPYMMAGPRYMRTRLTSSLIRAIRSPVLLRR